MTRDRKIVENQGVPEYAVYADLPLPADFKGLALVQDTYTLYKSNGTVWTAQEQALQDNSFVLWGDSITSNCHMSVVTPTAIARSGSTVTVTSGTHLMQPGKKVKVANLMPDDFNGIVECATVGATTWTYEKAGTQGAAVIAGSTHPSSGVMDIKDLTNLSGNGFWVWANAAMGGCLNLVANVARGGWSANYALSVIDDLEDEIQATGKVANNAYIAYGINDIVGLARTAEETIADLADIIIYNKKMGRRVWLDTLKPLGTSHPSYGASAKASIALVNNWILNTAPKLYGCISIDTYSTILNPLTGGAKVGMLGAETIHPNVCAAMDFIGPAIATAFKKYLNWYSILPASIGDTYGQSNLSKNLSDVGPWVTTGNGTLSGNVTPGVANVCANMKVTETGAASASAVQINTNTNGYPEQQYDLSATVAAGDSADLTYNFDYTRLTAGQKVRFCLHVDLTNLDSASGNIKAFSAYVVCAANSATGYYQVLEYSGTNSPFTGVSSSAKSLDLVSEEITIPASVTAFNLHVKLTGAGALAGAAAVAKVSRIGLLSQ